MHREHARRTNAVLSERTAYWLRRVRCVHAGAQASARPGMWTTPARRSTGTLTPPTSFTRAASAKGCARARWPPTHLPDENGMAPHARTSALALPAPGAVPAPAQHGWPRQPHSCRSAGVHLFGRLSGACHRSVACGAGCGPWSAGVPDDQHHAAGQALDLCVHAHRLVAALVHRNVSPRSFTSEAGRPAPAR